MTTPPATAVAADTTQPETAAGVLGSPRFWLKAEGVGAFVAGGTAFSMLGGNPVVFVIGLLLVDVSMAGYLVGPRPGAILYNAAHNWFTALALIGLGYGTGTTWLMLAGCVVAAHVGADRLIGYGLKYPTAFTDTHLGRIGRRPTDRVRVG